jgi:hypothetical protein
MKLSSICYLLSAICCFAQPQQAWVARYNGGFTNQTHTPLAMKLDNAGNIYVAGSSQNASNFYDYVILKYAPNGAQLYASRYSSPNGMNLTINGFVLDQNGNTYVTGTGGTAKVGTNGAVTWVASYAGNDVAVDTNGNVYVTGFSTTEYATAKLDASGSNLWTRAYVGVSGPDNPVGVSQKVAVDGAGNVYVAGWTDYPPGWSYPGQTNLNYYSHPVMLMYDGAGNCLWTNAYYNGGYGINWGQTKGLIPDNLGNVYVTGNGDITYQTAEVDIMGETLWSFTSYGGEPGVREMKIDNSGDVYLTGAGNRVVSVNTSYVTFKLDTTGQTLWRTNFSGPISDGATGVSLDNINSVYVTGVSTNTTTGNDFVTIKYDTNGNQQWVIRYNGPANGNDGANAIAVAPDGSIYVTGYSQNASGGSDITTIKYGNLANVQKKSDGSIQLQCFGNPGQSYHVQATTNFLNWTDLSSVMAGTNGLFQFLDTNAPLFPYRFYRWY